MSDENGLLTARRAGEPGLVGERGSLGATYHDDPYHAGEIEAQTRAGVRNAAARSGGSIRRVIPESFAQFIEDQRLAVVASIDDAGGVWATAAAGDPGVLSVPAEDELQILTSASAAFERLRAHIAGHPPVGVLIMDLATRRRVRVNGTAEMRQDGILRVHTREVFGNCPQYIQLRVPDAAAASAACVDDAAPQTSDRLSPAQQQRIAKADTFFLATAHPERGADASHRGGMPGFVHIEDDRTLLWPDYSGNNMFQSLGNLMTNPRSGVLFLDFETGSALQLTGEARILWDSPRVRDFPGAHRLLEFKAAEVVDTANAIPLRMRLVEYSPANPR